MSMKNYRLTIPSNYSEGSIGHTDASARQGYYIEAGSPNMAQVKLAKQLRDQGMRKIDNSVLRWVDLEIDSSW